MSNWPHIPSSIIRPAGIAITPPRIAPRTSGLRPAIIVPPGVLPPTGAQLSGLGMLPVTPIATSNDPFVDVTFTFPDRSSMTHKARLPHATAALADARRIADSRAELDNSGDYAIQLEGTRAIFRAIGSFYKNANVTPQSDPVYVKWWREWFATGTTDGFDCVVPLDFHDPAWERRNGVGPTQASGYNPNTGISMLMKKMWLFLNKSLPSDSYIGAYPIRMQINELGDLVELCQGTFGSPSDHGDRNMTGEGVCEWSPGALWTGCAEEGNPHEGCASYKWSTMIWRDPPPLPGRAEENYQRFRALPPMRWFFDAAADLVGRLSSRQNELTQNVATATWLDALRYAATWNVVSARDLHVLPTELEALSANIPSNQRLSQIAAQEANMREAASFSSTAMSVGSMFGPYGTLMAAVISAIVMIEAAVFPPAVATRVDFFGRLLPVALKADMNGQTVFTPPSETQTTPASNPPADVVHPKGDVGSKVAIGLGFAGVVGLLLALR